MINQDKFLYFVKLQLETGDYDAHIPFLKEYCNGMSGEESVYMGFLYMAYYNEASAHLAFVDRLVIKQFADGGGGGLMQYPIELQRRNLYGGRIYQHLDEVHARRPLHGWLLGAQNWCQLLNLVESVWGNGRWATYTSAELLMHLGDLNHIEPDRFEIASSSGPRQGLEFLGLTPTEQSAHEVHQTLNREGLACSVSQCESLLCDWAGMNKGTFYAGRNIDRQQGRIHKVDDMLAGETVCASKLSELWVIRHRVFPENTLGELGGWHGIDKDRLKVYQATGRVLAPWEGR